MNLKILPVILAGGIGARLWPLSRETFPKQFLRLVSQHSLLQETVLRVAALEGVHHPMIVCNSEHYVMSQEHLQQIGVEGYQYLLEPVGRNTAPAIACAALYALQNQDEEDLMLVLPSDHYIADQMLFIDAVQRAAIVAERGFLVTFGVVPTHAETGYGYIQVGEQITEGGYLIHQFVEKPRLELARQFIDMGNFYWNSGMFMLKPRIYLEELQKSSPLIYQMAKEAMQKGGGNSGYYHLNEEAWSACPNNSIDYAVMEQTHKGVVIPLAAAWNDLGCWEAVAKSGDMDASANVIRGEALVKNSENCFISSENQMVAVLGLKDQIVVTTPDVVLVAHKAHSQDVKHFVAQLKTARSDLVIHHKKQYGAVGYKEQVAAQDHFDIDHFMLKPLSNWPLSACIYPTQWMVVKGEAEISVQNQTHRLPVHSSLLIDANLPCQIINHTAHAVHLVRIQIKSTVAVEKV